MWHSRIEVNKQDNPNICSNQDNHRINVCKTWDINYNNIPILVFMFLLGVVYTRKW